MNITPGLRLGPYEIVSPLGAGGMGEVYRARDTRLDRTVAIKVLPAALAQSAQLRLRFEREAKAISALAHPHICTLHDVGNHDGIDYIVMEHLEGESLADRLTRSPLPVDEALRYAIQIADALDKAHRRGIIHRDLKPGNVMITRAGAKLLDFGLARTVDTEAVSADSETIAHKPITEEGTIVGTVQYMAPEQLESRPADARTDIFAFGAVLYEMLTGRRAFGGKSRASVIASILAAEPQPLSAIQPTTPPPLERVIRICLAKDPDDRWQSAHDVRLELEGLAAAAPVPAKTRSRLHGWIAAVAVAIVAAAWLIVERRGHRPAPSVRFEMYAPASGRYNSADAPVILSPDGRRMIVRLDAGQQRDSLWLRRLDDTRLEVLPHTSGAYDAFWSDDGRQVAFFTDGKLRRLDLAQSASVAIGSATDTRGGTWAGDTILFAPTPLSPILRISAKGGATSPATRLDPTRKETGHWRPSFLPDGKRFLYVSRTADGEQGGVYLASLDSFEVRRVLDIPVTTIYADGHLLYVNDHTLYAQPFDPGKEKTTGEAVVLARDVDDSAQYGSPGFSAGGGSLAWHVRGGVGLTMLSRVTLDGKETPLDADGRNLDLSRDGRSLAMTRVDPQRRNGDIWVYDLARGTSSRVTHDPSEDGGPVWSPDGRRIAYVMQSPTGVRVRTCLASGIGGDEDITGIDGWIEVVDWSADGTTLLVERDTISGRIDLGTLDLKTRRITPFGASPFNESSARFSPDGKWIAYESDESGEFQVYAQPFPPDGTRVRISASGGEAPRWTHDGRTLFYLGAERMLTSVAVTRGPEGLSVGPPKTHVKLGTIDYTIRPDGGEVYVSRTDAPTPQPIIVVTNWNAR